MLCSGADHHMGEMGRLEMQHANLLRDQASTVCLRYMYHTGVVGVKSKGAHTLYPQPLARRVAVGQDLYNAMIEAARSAPACESE